MPRRPSFAALLILTVASAPAQPPSASGNWPFDVLVHRGGTTFQGLIVEETADGVTFRLVKRPPGRPTVTLTTFFTKEETKDLKRLADADRATLRERLAELDAASNGPRDGAISLEAADWLGRKGGAKRYEGEQFILVSSAPDEITRRAAGRLEQIFTAFARVLPPRHAAARPTRVDLAGTPTDYRDLLKAIDVTAVNAAVFLPADRRIVCGSDLTRLGEELYRVAVHHQQQLATADKTEKELRDLYKTSKPDLERFLAALKKEREKVKAAERANEAAFDRATRRLFAVLFHEAFHSYVMGAVYPPMPAADVKAGKGTGELPRWLNEGLAQLFEDPVIEAGELRVGHADPDRLKRVQDALTGKAGGPDAGGLIPLADLIRAGRESFVAAHAGQKQASDRTYLTAWAVAHYLTFEVRAVGTKEFDDYLTAVNTGTDPAQAFATLVKRDLPTFERDLHGFLKKLQPDGTVKK